MDYRGGLWRWVVEKGCRCDTGSTSRLRHISHAEPHCRCIISLDMTAINAFVGDAISYQKGDGA